MQTPGPLPAHAVVPTGTVVHWPRFIVDGIGNPDGTPPSEFAAVTGPPTLPPSLGPAPASTPRMIWPRSLHTPLTHADVLVCWQSASLAQSCSCPGRLLQVTAQVWVAGRPGIWQQAFGAPHAAPPHDTPCAPVSPASPIAVPDADDEVVIAADADDVALAPPVADDAVEEAPVETGGVVPSERVPCPQPSAPATARIGSTAARAFGMPGIGAPARTPCRRVPVRDDLETLSPPRRLS
jgi:hypothetical protein